MVCNIDRNQIDLTKIAIKALQRTIINTAANFAQKEQREFIMKGIFDAMEIDDDTIQTDAIEALADVPEVAYEHISDQVTTIGQWTQKYLQAQNYAHVREIFEFWINLAIFEGKAEKLNKSRGYFSTYENDLLGLVYQGMTMTEFDESDT